MGYNAVRTAEDIKREITTEVRALKDPRLDTSVLTVVRAEVAHDLSYCKVYVSSLNGIEDAKSAVKVLNGNAKGYLRSQVGKNLGLRKTPDMKFIADDSIEKGIEMFRKLSEAEKKDK